jgi:hypothetical protein
MVDQPEKGGGSPEAAGPRWPKCQTLMDLAAFVQNPADLAHHIFRMRQVRAWSGQAGIGSLQRSGPSACPPCAGVTSGDNPRVPNHPVITRARLASHRCSVVIAWAAFFDNCPVSQFDLASILTRHDCGHRY